MIIIPIFLGAFLSFLIQPLIAKALLPQFGGAPAVWATSMTFFQIALVAGYGYSHLLTMRMAVSKQALIHSFVLLASLMLMKFDLQSLSIFENLSPAFSVFCILGTTVGLPYVALASTAPLTQAWASKIFAHQNPYRLYALSNAGSLGALLMYPFVIEPNFPLATQYRLWSAGFVSFCLVCLMLCVAVLRKNDLSAPNRSSCAESIPIKKMLLWFLYAATGVILLLSFTNEISHDIAAIPFLWVVPLALYLATFILAFAGPNYYPRKLILPLGLSLILLLSEGSLTNAAVSVWLALTLSLTGLFLTCLICHSELARSVPKEDSLTLFYLILCAGGAAGGIFVSFIAPVLFNRLIELQVGFLSLAALLLVTYWASIKHYQSSIFGSRAKMYLLLCYFGFAGSLVIKEYYSTHEVREQIRNFYGVLTIREKDTADPARHRKIESHGRIVHGSQFQNESLRYVPTEYYGTQSGIGKLLAQPLRRPLKIGAIGLGIGTIAAYARADDILKFYEINPDVIAQAREHFSFIQHAPNTVEIIEGDGRISLRRESPQQFDVLVLDAFSSDSIPLHLLTVEAFELYLTHLKTEGVLAIHISNRHLELENIILRLALELKLNSAHIVSDANENTSTTDAEWMMLSHHIEPISKLGGEIIKPGERPGLPELWTDQFSNLLAALK